MSAVTVEVYSHTVLPVSVLLQHGADPNIRNTDGKSALDLADPSAKAVLTGESAAHLTSHDKLKFTRFCQNMSHDNSVTSPVR